MDLHRRNKGHYKITKIVSDRPVRRESMSILEFRPADRSSLGNVEREEHEILSGARDGKAAVFFSIDPVSPYAYPLDGQHYEVGPGFGPTGLCPLCNNEKHREMDRFFLENLDKRGAWKVHGFDEKVVVEHLVNHLGPIYTSTGRELLDAFAARTEVNVLFPKVRTKIERAAVHAVARANIDVVDEREARHDDEVLISPFSSPGVEAEEIPPSVFGRPAGAVAKKWYAFSGKEQQGQLRPWGDKRMTTEVEKRADDSIVFYDEMVMVRRMGLDIYKEVMDGDGEPIIDKEGAIVGYKEKNYTAALSAAKLVKDVAMDLAKLAIIGVKLEGQGEKMRQLSPTMQAMINDIGILEKRELPDPAQEITAEIMDLGEKE